MSGIYVDQPEIKQKPVSTVRAQNSLWLVKVPKYVTDRLSKCEPGSQFGVIQTQRSAAGQEFTFEVDPKLCEQGNGLPACPSVHTMKLGTLAGVNRNLAVYSDTEDAINIEGIVKTKFDVMQRSDPKSSLSYMKLKRFEAEKKMDPGRKIVITNKSHNNFKPSNVSREQMYTTKAEREEKLRNKRTRLDPEAVEDMLLRAFKKNQYISQKHLVSITEQPEAYLKGFLHKLCVYNQKTPHKNTWELKPEYRRYETDGQGPSEET